MCPPLGACTGGVVEVRQPYEQLGTHPRQPALVFVRMCVCVCVSAYVSAFLGDDKRSWLPQDHVVTTGTTTTATTTAAAAAAAAGAAHQLLLHLKTQLNLAARQRGPFLFVLLSRRHFTVWLKAVRSFGLEGITTFSVSVFTCVQACSWYEYIHHLIAMYWEMFSMKK